jgi:diguanylate cyclase (GGDEF)-like protein/PAS domain S-box-containing protein
VLSVDVTAQRRAQNALRQREVQLRQVLSDVGDALVVIDRDGLVCFANPAVETLFGTPPEALLSSAPDWVADVGQGGVVEVQASEGRRRIVESRVSDTEWEGHAARLVALRDVTERHAAEERARLLERAVESSANGVVICDARSPEAPITYVNRAFERITGYVAAEVLGRNPEFLQGDDRAQPEFDEIRKALRMRSDIEVVVRNYRKDGTLFWNQMSIAPVRNRAGEVTHFVGLLNDLTDRRRYEAELAYLATHDTVTGLPRFLAVEEFTKGALAEATHSGGRVAMFYIDLDRFHSINETMGHATGDQALRIVAERMRSTVGERGRVSRIAGDEFVVVSVPARGDDPMALAERLRLAMEQPIEVSPYTLYMTGSVGVSVFPNNARDAKDLLHQSEAAAARAKRQGRNAICAFSNDQVQELADRLSLGGRLRDAARNGELVLHYQPQVSAHNGQLVGLEALVRWESPELGLLPPARFIRVAEELGLIVDLGLWVLDTACRQAKAWLDLGVGEFTIAVNVSALQLQRPTFVADVEAALARSGLPAHHLELELTESSIMENVERMAETMHALKKLGVLLALDDFGIGYSSLNYLKRFPIDKLKIDQSFVRDVTRDSGDAGIARAIIAMGHQLQMTVMAEGVETAAQMGYLRRNHCDQFQGWLFGGPVPTDEAEALLRRKFLSPESFAHNESGLTILLLDDEENILRSLVRLLRRDGYTVLTANSAREAFEQLGKRNVQVVVSDQRMPDISGTEFLSQVKALYPETIRLVLSGYTDLKTVTEAINLGSIYKFLTKPWDDDELRREIREAFRAYETRQARDDAA